MNFVIDKKGIVVDGVDPRSHKKFYEVELTERKTVTDDTAPIFEDEDDDEDE